MGINIEDLNSYEASLSSRESFSDKIRDLSQEELRLTGGSGYHGRGKGKGHGKGFGGDDDIFFSRGPGNSRELFFADNSGFGFGGDDDIFFSRGPGNSRELFFADDSGFGDNDGVFFSRGPGNSRELFYTL